MDKSFEKAIGKAFGLLLAGCLFFTVLQTAAPITLPLHELFLLASLTAFVFTVKAPSAKIFSAKLKDLFKAPSAVVFIISTIIYVLIDAIGLLYSPCFKYAVTKYSVIVPMAVLALLIWCCLSQKPNADALYLFISLAGVGVLALAVADRFYNPDIIYLRRLSLIADYNRFAQTVFTAFIIGIFLLWRSALSYPCKLAVTFIFMSVNVTGLMLSGSRRTYLMLIPICIIVVCAIALHISKSGVAIGRAASVICFLLVCTAAALASAALCRGFILISDNRFDSADKNSESSVTDIAESIGGLLENKRVVIWKTALDEALNYEKSDILLGKGSGYESYFYNTDNPVTRLYTQDMIKPNWMHPHNQFLSDFLSGGVLRLTACISVWCSLTAICIFITARRFMRGLPLIISAGIVFLNAFISGRYGFIYDKFFWLIAVFAVWELLQIRAGET